ncbi:MAG: radical SAM protein [Deltaproteobacteria bacterium]|nr:radical SAM protein [Deltaproteobacteria bacterium]
MNSDSIFTLADRYQIPLEAVIKSDLLRLGVSFSPEALKVCAQAKPKSYFIFSFDRTTQKDLSELERKSVPEEIALIRGPYDLKRTIVSVRVNPKSLYRIAVGATGRSPLQLRYNNEIIANILLPQQPPYYTTPLKSGKPVTDIAPTIEWGYLIYLTAFRLCQYWGEQEECQFCDINNNYRQQLRAGRSYTGIKNSGEILEALQIINELDQGKVSQAYTVSGGAVTKELNGMKEAEFYAQYARAIEEKFPGRWIGKANVQALPLEEVKILKNAGYQIYHPNFEVWDKNLFVQLCAGKERYIGQKEWIQRTLNAAEVFGAEGVIPNFVAGIEMSKPHGFRSVDEAIASTHEGLEFFMSRGILPRFTSWCVEPGTALFESNPEPPPLEYYVRLLAIYRETFHKHKLPSPKGYGQPGLGKAVFSVSPFMDVLGSE